MRGCSDLSMVEVSVTSEAADHEVRIVSCRILSITLRCTSVGIVDNPGSCSARLVGAVLMAEETVLVVVCMP